MNGPAPLRVVLIVTFVAVSAVIFVVGFMWGHG